MSLNMKFFFFEGFPYSQLKILASLCLGVKGTCRVAWILYSYICNNYLYPEVEIFYCSSCNCYPQWGPWIGTASWQPTNWKKEDPRQSLSDEYLKYMCKNMCKAWEWIGDQWGGLGFLKLEDKHSKREFSSFKIHPSLLALSHFTLAISLQCTNMDTTTYSKHELHYARGWKSLNHGPEPGQSAAIITWRGATNCFVSFRISISKTSTKWLITPFQVLALLSDKGKSGLKTNTLKIPRWLPHVFSNNLHYSPSLVC